MRPSRVHPPSRGEKLALIAAQGEEAEARAVALGREYGDGRGVVHGRHVGRGIQYLVERIERRHVSRQKPSAIGPAPRHLRGERVGLGARP